MKIGHGLVYKTEYSPDDKILAVATSTGVFLYDTANYEVLKYFPDSFVDNVEWSPDGSRIAYSTGAEIKILDLTSEKLTHCEEKDVMVVGDEMSWSPDGNMLASIDSTDARGVVYLWDVLSGKITQRLIYPEDPVSGRSVYAEGVDWSPDSRQLAVAYSFVNILAPEKPSDIIVWTVSSESSSMYKQWPVPNDYHLLVMGGLEWTPSGKYLILGGAFISVYNTENGDLLSLLDAPTSNRFSLSSDGTMLFLAGQENKVISYDVPNLHQIKEYRGRIESPLSIGISSDGKLIVASDSFFDGFDVWNSQSGEIINTTLLGSHWNDDVKFSPGGNTFAALGRDNRIRLYNAEKGELLQTLDGLEIVSQGDIYWSKDGNTIMWLGGGEDQSRFWQFWNLSAEKKIMFQPDKDSVFMLGALQNNKRIVVSSDNEIQVWTLDDVGEYSLTAKTANQIVYYKFCSAWSFSFEKLAICDVNSANNRAKLIVYNPNLQPITSIEDRNILGYDIPTWSPDGKWLATIDELRCKKILCAGNDHFLNVRSADTMELAFSYKVDLSKPKIIWSPDSNWLVTTGSPEQYGLTIYPISIKGNPLQIIEDTGKIEGIDWSQNGKHIVLTGYNGVTYLYNAEKILEKYFSLGK